MKFEADIGTVEEGELQTLLSQVDGKEVWIACIKVNGKSLIECLGSNDREALENRRYVLDAIAFFEGKTEERLQ